MASPQRRSRAQDAVPDLKGTWTGKGKVDRVRHAIAHHPGTQTAADPPRVREIEATHVVEGQDGRVAWGRSSSAVADTKEPFAWAHRRTTTDSIVGADIDGYFRITLITPDRMEKCYVHNGVSPTRSMVATCYLMDGAALGSPFPSGGGPGPAPSQYDLTFGRSAMLDLPDGNDPRIPPRCGRSRIRRLGGGARVGAGLSRAPHHHRGAVLARHRVRPDRAHRRAEDHRAHRPAGGGRQQAGRERHARHRDGRRPPRPTATRW